MDDQQEDPEGMYDVQHQYMCSECHQLFNTLEEVLVHQQIHTGQEGEEGETGEAMAIQGISEDGESQYQCLECGTLLRNPDELLLHQELHMREAGFETEEHELCEVLETDEAGTEGQVSGPIQYQCLDCLALFDSPEVWLAHRQTHSKSSTHSATETEYVLQPDGTVTPLVSVQNFVLSEQQAGEILAQVLAQQQQQQQSAPQPSTPSRATFLPPASPLPGSATMRLQICSAQALADGSSTPGLRRAKLLPPLLTPLGVGSVGKLGVPENGLQRLEVALYAVREEKQQQGEVVIFHPYECSECALLFQTPEDFLQHQGEHFLAQEKESGEDGVMMGYEEDRGTEEERREENGGRVAEERGKGTGRRALAKRSGNTPLCLQCSQCQRTFTSANRLAAHRRVHEHGTYECRECDKVFKKAASLQTHMRTHSGEARYLCVDCGHGFNTEMTLIIHRKSHTAEPLHRCEHCAKTFSNMTKFLYHRRTHTTKVATATPTPVVLVPAAPRRVSLSALSILQRARALREGDGGEGSPMETEGGEENLMAPLTEAEMEIGGSGEDTASSSLSRAEGEKENGVDVEGTLGGSGESQPGEQTADPGSSTDPNPSGPRGAFPCPSCSQSFPSLLRLVKHRHTAHVSESRFKCSVCTKTFKKQMHLRNHLRTHTGERPFQCSDCGKTFSSLANLSRHNLTHSGMRPYRCDICHRTFTQSSNLRQHRLLHANLTPSPCPDCPATFVRPAKLAAHRYTVHPGAPAPFSCPHCQAGFLHRRKRDRHCQEVHPTEAQADGEGGLESQPQVCPDGEPLSEPSTSEDPGTTSSMRGGLDCTVCGKKLNSAANWRLHQLSHGLVPGRSCGGAVPRGKSHQCLTCGKLFVSSSGVALHQRIHTGERPFPCNLCGKRFRQNTHLREHLRTHTGERPFRCEICDKGFVQSMHLAEHRRTHTGERPHACLVCGKAFKSFSNLRNHRKTHARQQRQEEAAAAQVAMETSAAVTLVEASQVELANGQPQLIHIQTSDLQQTQGTPTIMCNEFGETIAIIETSEGGTLPLAEAIEIYHTALENSLGMDSITVESLQLI
ncbi:zinc finger protein 574 [Coregonus clupeaformis]|uniref:zinc finger protein 574 n=1 Tax=Coregonus clupeaformis TaxID=59861 RepID=UPI001BE063DB|nr:zinc finger protein 574 [Coregonus clupeaformis]